VDRRNKLRGLHPIPQGFTEIGNADFQDHITDGGVWPDRIQERGLRHELPGMFHEILQDGKRFGFQRHGHGLVPQAPIHRVETEGAKHPLHTRRHSVDLSSHSARNDLRTKNEPCCYDWQHRRVHTFSPNTLVWRLPS
jgi:hypothetical protein